MSRGLGKQFSKIFAIIGSLNFGRKESIKSFTDVQLNFLWFGGILPTQKQTNVKRQKRRRIDFIFFLMLLILKKFSN